MNKGVLIGGVFLGILLLSKKSGSKVAAATLPATSNNVSVAGDYGLPKNYAGTPSGLQPYSGKPPVTYVPNRELAIDAPYKNMVNGKPTFTAAWIKAWSPYVDPRFKLTPSGFVIAEAPNNVS